MSLLLELILAHQTGRELMVELELVVHHHMVELDGWSTTVAQELLDVEVRTPCYNLVSMQ